jgi:hypothetical protein
MRGCHGPPLLLQCAPWGKDRKRDYVGRQEGERKGGKVAQIMNTHVSKYKNGKIKFFFNSEKSKKIRWA